ncbi:MAG TPA: SGNH/GDSL hydrolase family protein, partial [Caulobacteraceae bacterium]
KPIVLVGALAALIAGSPASAMNWARSWAVSPQAPTPSGGRFPGSPTFHDQTLRQIVRLSGGGSKVRVRFTNEYGAAPVQVGAAHLALAAEGGSIRPGSDHVLTFGGKPTAVILAGAPLLSDAVDMKAAPLASLAISLYLPGQVDACTCHATAMQAGYLAEGDATGAASLPGAKPLQQRAMISAVEVASDGPAKTIVAFGDSITDGVGSTPNANHRWPDLLADRLIKRGGPAVYVANEGISGNRVLGDGAGVSALARFDRDVLATPGLAYVIVFEGINDIGIGYAAKDGPMAKFMPAGAGPPPTAEDLIAGYRQMIARVHERGAKIYGATIAPYEGAAYASPEGDRVREAVNHWIRTGHAFDGVLDFDAAMRDPKHPARIRDGFHAGDHLHGSDAGYHAVADSIDLKLFQ